MSGTSNDKHRDLGSWQANYLNNGLRLFGFAASTLVVVAIYRYLIKDIVSDDRFVGTYIALWVLSAYIVLPRFYRLVSKIMMPSYFIGRTQTSDGLLGDPINLAFNGSKGQLISAMEAAGWTMAEPLSLKSSLRMIYAAVLGVKYSNAPVSSLFLFGRQQDIAFEKDIDNNPRRRHHIRFWKTPKDWWLPGGYQADWLAAATFDKNIGLSLFTGQVTHKIDANVDQERDFVIATLQQAKVVSSTKVVKHFTSSYRSRNGGGDHIHTDGSLPFVTL